MPQSFGAGTELVHAQELNDRLLAARAEELRAGRDRLMKLRLTTEEEAEGLNEPIGIDDQPDLAPLLTAARIEAAVATHRARVARRVAYAACALAALTTVGTAAAGLKAYRKINRDTAQIERLSGQVRTQREIAGMIAEERDTLRADLFTAREARARAEGQVLVLTGAANKPTRRTTAGANP